MLSTFLLFGKMFLVVVSIGNVLVNLVLANLDLALKVWKQLPCKKLCSCVNFAVLFIRRWKWEGVKPICGYFLAQIFSIDLTEEIKNTHT